MKLVVGFVTYNQISSKYLAYFLPSLQAALSFLSPNDYRVMVFDNSDSDNNENRLALEFFDYKNKFKIKYFNLDKNIGFGRAYNHLFKQAEKIKAEYFLVINPDIILEKNAILNLVNYLESENDYVAAAPKILRWDFDSLQKTRQIDSCGLILKPGLRFNDLGQGELDRGQYDKARILAPTGAAGLFKMSKLKEIRLKDGYFDAQFFMYKEDCDLAYRLKLADLKTGLVSRAIMYHHRTAAFYDSGPLAFFRNRLKKSKKVRAWSFYNQHLIFLKYFTKEPFFSRIIVIFQVILLFIFSLILEQFNLKQYKKLIFKL